jgi:multidrug efflux system membrane fusion protein
MSRYVRRLEARSPPPPPPEVHFKEGDIVQKDDRLFTLDLRPYKAAFDQALAAVDAAVARNELAVHEKNRSKSLLDEKALSQREYDERNNESKAAWASVKSAKAALEIAALNLEYAEVKAPITGRVGRADITVGNLVEAGPGAPVLTTIQSVDTVYADFDMDEHTYLRVVKSVHGAENKAQEMPVLMALADEQEFTRKGKIRSFDNQLSGDSGTMRVRAEFANPDGILTPGLFARIRLGGAEQYKAVLINDAAVGTDQNRKFVYVVDAEGKVNYRPVTLGALHDGLRTISDGLQPGENIIVNGLMRVHPGMTVQPMVVSMETLKPAEASGGIPEQKR